jgi:hypothetical protein
VQWVGQSELTSYEEKNPMPMEPSGPVDGAQPGGSTVTTEQIARYRADREIESCRYHRGHCVSDSFARLTTACRQLTPAQAERLAESSQFQVLAQNYSRLSLQFDYFCLVGGGFSIAAIATQPPAMVALVIGVSIWLIARTRLVLRSTRERMAEFAEAAGTQPSLSSPAEL